MKYYSEAGLIYSVSTAGVSDKGTHYAVTIHNLDGSEDTLISIEPSVNRLEIETKLAEYAKENNLLPELTWKIKQGERVIQGEPKTANDFIPVDDKAKAEAFDKYLSAKSHITVLEAEKTKAITGIKEEYAEKIKAEIEIMDSIESVVRNGTRKEECQASWERDLENGIMLLIRHDNLKVLQWRKMTEAEAQVAIDDQEAQAE